MPGVAATPGGLSGLQGWKPLPHVFCIGSLVLYHSITCFHWIDHDKSHSIISGLEIENVGR